LNWRIAFTAEGSTAAAEEGKDEGMLAIVMKLID
jgi:hypothetical protein